MEERFPLGRTSQDGHMRCSCDLQGTAYESLRPTLPEGAFLLVSVSWPPFAFPGSALKVPLLLYLASYRHRS